MIKSIKHQGLSKFHKTGNTSGIQSKHEKRLRLQLTILESGNQQAQKARVCLKGI